MNYLLIGLLTLLSFSSSASSKCDRIAKKAVKSIYALSDTSKVTTDVSYIGNKTDRDLGIEVKNFSVSLEVNGGSAIYEVETDSTCLVTKVKMLGMD